MDQANDGDVWLFSYGTLRQTNVQLAIFGRVLEGQADILPGYALSPLLITDPSVIATSGTADHTIVHYTGDSRDGIAGIVFKITQAELSAADDYEVSDVRRVALRLGSGIEAFAYVSTKP